MTPSIPPIDRAQLPAAVRNGDSQRQQDYRAALAFERALVSQMTEAMTKNTGALGEEDEGGDAASKHLRQMLPDTLTDALMNAGGIGLASQLDAMWHPATKRTSVTDAQQARDSGGGAVPPTGSSA